MEQHEEGGSSLWPVVATIAMKLKGDVEGELAERFGCVCSNLWKVWQLDSADGHFMRSSSLQTEPDDKSMDKDVEEAIGQLDFI